MKIGINASFIRKPGTGIGEVSLNFLKALAEENSSHEFILFLEESLPKELSLPENFKSVVFLPCWKRDDLIRKIWWEKCLLPKKIKASDCDLFFSLYQCPTILPKKIPHLMLVHDLIPKIFPEYLNNSRKRKYQKLTEKGIKKANHILTVSKQTEKDVIQKLKVSGEKITTAYIDTDKIYKKDPTPEKIKSVLEKYSLNPGYILGGAGLDKRKNIEGVINAYERLLKKNKEAQLFSKVPNLVVIGKLMPELSPLITDVEKIVKEKNLTQKVKLLGFVPQAEMPALYSQASVFVYPTMYEGFGLPALEAINQGTAVITTKNSSLPEVGRDAILYCNPDDPDEIAKIIQKILLDENLRESLRRKGKERANDFSWKKFVQKFLNLAETKF